MKPMPKFRIWREQRVILASVNGSWNRFTAEDYAQEFKVLAKPLAGTDWAHIVYLDNWQLGVPEIEPVITELVNWCLANGLRYAAQVYCPNMIKRYQLDKMIVEHTATFERRVYPDEQQALAWLSSEGFTVDSLSLKHTG
ncbi:hypothetical protein [Rheinheimera fenheensis]|uniref:hypothetical protein n=1 Tax=Rheinheimera fenheensis TaxID=3152295 RepID=UPI00325CC1B4